MTEQTMLSMLSTLLTMSILGGLLAAVLFALKPLLKNRLSKTFQYYLWLLAALQLLLPFSLTLPAPQTEQPVENMAQAVTVRDFVHSFTKPDHFEANTTDPIEPSAVPDGDVKANLNPVIPEAQNPGLFEREVVVREHTPDKKPTVVGWPAVLLVVWGGGASLFMSIQLIAYTRFTRVVTKTLVPKALPDGFTGEKLRLYTSFAVKTPMLIGLFRPKIVLPDREYPADQLRYILLHELTHYKRRDIWVKWLFTAVNALHWFNPLVWLVRREIDRACELSCDEAVIRFLDGRGKQRYGETLLSVVTESRLPVGVGTMCEDKRTLKERLTAIVRYKGRSKAVILISVLLVIALSACALTLGAKTEAPETEPQDGVTYELRIEAGEGGTIPAGMTEKINGRYAPGAKITIMARSFPTHVFSGWTGSGSYEDINDGHTVFTMPAQDTVIKANFAPAPPVISVTPHELLSSYFLTALSELKVLEYAAAPERLAEFVEKDSAAFNKLPRIYRAINYLEITKEDFLAANDKALMDDKANGTRYVSELQEYIDVLFSGDVDQMIKRCKSPYTLYVDGELMNLYDVMALSRDELARLPVDYNEVLSLCDMALEALENADAPTDEHKAAFAALAERISEMRANAVAKMKTLLDSSASGSAFRESFFALLPAIDWSEYGKTGRVEDALAALAGLISERAPDSGEIFAVFRATTGLDGAYSAGYGSIACDILAGDMEGAATALSRLSDAEEILVSRYIGAECLWRGEEGREVMDRVYAYQLNTYAGSVRYLLTGYQELLLKERGLSMTPAKGQINIQMRMPDNDWYSSYGMSYISLVYPILTEDETSALQAYIDEAVQIDAYKAPGGVFPLSANLSVAKEDGADPLFWLYSDGTVFMNGAQHRVSPELVPFVNRIILERTGVDMLSFSYDDFKGFLKAEIAVYYNECGDDGALLRQREVLQTVDDSASLIKLETLFSAGEYVTGGGGCPFNSLYLTLTKVDGTAIVLDLAGDSCPLAITKEGITINFSGPGTSSRREFEKIFNEIQWQ